MSDPIKEPNAPLAPNFSLEAGSESEPESDQLSEEDKARLHAAFQVYLEEKAAEAARQAPAPQPAGDDSAAAHAQRINDIVEAERLRRRRTLLLWSALLLPPIALAVWVLVWPPGGVANLNSPEFVNTVRPMVADMVGEQIEPAVKAQLSPEVDKLVETKVADKIQGASPARVEELSNGLRQVSTKVTQAQAGLRELQVLGAELPQLRERVETMSNGGVDAGTVKRLEGRLADLDAKLSRSVQALQAQVEKNSSSLRSLSVKLDSLERPRAPRIAPVATPTP